MANQHKGEVDLVIGVTTYTLCLSANEIVKIENLLDVGIIEMAGWFNDPQKLRLGNMRAMLWAAMQRHHSSITLEEAGDIVAKVGLRPTVIKLGEVLQASFPAQDASDKPNPPGAGQDGTGPNSN